MFAGEFVRRPGATGRRKVLGLLSASAVLAALGRRLDAALKEGLPPDGYPRAEALREANIIARKILRLSVRVDGKARSA